MKVTASFLGTVEYVKEVEVPDGLTPEEIRTHIIGMIPQHGQEQIDGWREESAHIDDVWFDVENHFPPEQPATPEVYVDAGDPFVQMMEEAS